MSLVFIILTLTPPVGAVAKPADFAGLIKVIVSADDPSIQNDLLQGMRDALVGRPNLVMPPGWAEAYVALAKSPSASVRDAAANLALRFGDRAAFEDLRKTVANRSAATSARIAAIDALAGVHDPVLPSILHGLLEDSTTRATALRALAVTANPDTPQRILASYSRFSPAERAGAIATLSSRVSYATALLAAVEQKNVSKQDFTQAALLILDGYPDPSVKSKIQKIWGTLRPTSVQKKEMITRLRQELTPQSLAQANRGQGRAIFSKACSNCHTLFDSGGKIGPELTGSQRGNLDYVLSNVVDPSAVVARDYQVNLVSTHDGRLLSGIVKREDERVLVLQTLNEIVALAKTDIESRKPTPDSIMPEGLLNGLKQDEIRDLVGYLAGQGQVALPGDAK